jgi:hypothetical protein
VTGEGVRRRSRETAARPKVVQFSLTHAEFSEISEAAASAGLARGAFAAEVTLAAARGAQARAASPLREALAELMEAAGLARRLGHEPQSGSGPVECDRERCLYRRSRAAPVAVGPGADCL